MDDRLSARDHQACARHSYVTRLERLLAGVPERVATIVAATRDEARIRSLLASEIYAALVLLASLEVEPAARNALLRPSPGERAQSGG